MNIISTQLHLFSNLNFVSDDVAFANAFSNIEPEDYFSAHQNVQTGLPHGLLFPRAAPGAAEQLADASLDLRNLAQFGRCHLYPRILHENVELRACLGESRCNVEIYVT